MLQHYTFQLPPYPRGYHIITDSVLGQVKKLPDQGLFQLYICHTSAALSINEDADPSVRIDFESFINHIVPEQMDFLTHTAEGPDDMPAHIKASFFGSSINIPILNGRLALGMWQGIYLCEFRNNASGRKLIATIIS